MDEGQIGDFIREKQIDFVIDATHPFAVEATLNIRRACDAEHTEYIRCLRESAVISQEEDAGIVTAGSVREAVAYLRHTKGNIFYCHREQGASVIYRNRRMAGEMFRACAFHAGISGTGGSHRI